LINRGRKRENKKQNQKPDLFKEKLDKILPENLLNHAKKF
jgi:hypothetical protein